LTRITIVFTSAPHSTSAGREGLDALLAISAYSEDICVVFVGDGVFQLLDNQDPAGILSKDYIPMFKLLTLYDIEDIRICKASLDARGVLDAPRVIEATLSTQEEVVELLQQSQKVLTF
jgi:tRNA 2-thiouridine synthesizing protein C